MYSLKGYTNGGFMMKAIIMAGGEGTRLRPLTCDKSKPMVPVRNMPVMEHIINLLKSHGIYDIAVTLQYLPDSIINYFKDGKDFGVNLTYFTEHTPLGTAGSVKNAESFLDGDFLVISGDALCDVNLKDAINFHYEKKADATIVLKSVPVPLEYGVVVTDNEGRIEGFIEKPQWSEAFSDTVNTGIYILNPKVLTLFGKNEKYDFAKDLFPRLLKEGYRLYGYVTNGYWCDIGDLNVYRHCHYDVLDKKLSIQPQGLMIAPDVYADQGAIIEEGAILKGPSYIGKNTHIQKGAVIDSYTTIGDNCFIAQNASIKRSVIWNNVTIGQNAQIRGSVICDKVTIKANSSIFEQSVIGCGTEIGQDVIIKPSIKIWPYKKVEDKSIVSSNLIWGTKHTNTIFGYRGIEGEINVDITPEFASRLGCAVGTVFSDKNVAVASDGSPCAIMLKNALISGLLSSGVRVSDMGEQTLPITRSGIRFYSLDYGVHVAIQKVGDTDRVFIDILDRFGANVDYETERKIESIFMREEFTRARGENIHEIEDNYEYKLYYLKEVINSTHSRDFGFNFLVQTSSDWGQRLISSAAADLKCNVKIIKTPIDFSDIPRVGAFAKEVAQKYDFGAIFDPSCEKMILVDDTGRIIADDLYISLISLITMRSYKGAVIVLEITAPKTIDILAQKYGAALKRTKASPLEVMSALHSVESKELRDQFLYRYDAVSALIKIMDFLKKNNLKLSQLVDEIPEFHLSKGEVDCSFDAKGKVIRKIIDEYRGKKIDLTEGVRIENEKGWVLILPDNKRPVCRVISEGVTEEYAKELTDIFLTKVKDIADKEKDEKE